MIILIQYLSFLGCVWRVHVLAVPVRFSAESRPHLPKHCLVIPQIEVLREFAHILLVRICTHSLIFISDGLLHQEPLLHEVPILHLTRNVPVLDVLVDVFLDSQLGDSCLLREEFSEGFVGLFVVDLCQQLLLLMVLSHDLSLGRGDVPDELSWVSCP